MEDVTKRKVSRRTLLKGAAAAAAIPIAAACVGSSTSTSTTAPAATAAGSGTKAPVKLSGNLNILQWSHFVPDFDTYLDKWAADWGAKNGVTVKIDRIPQADLPARFAAEVAAKSGHDVIAHFANGLPALFTTSLVDVTDICDRAANKYGGWLPAGEAIGKVKGKWYGFPDFAVPFLSSWRTDYWKAAGFNGDHLVNWQDLFDFAPKLKAAGNPVGCAMSQTSDAEHTWRSLMWSYGAYEFSKDGADRPSSRSSVRRPSRHWASWALSSFSRWNSSPRGVPFFGNRVAIVVCTVYYVRRSVQAARRSR